MKYRIVEYQNVLKDKKTKEVVKTGKPCYIIEGKSFFTTLFSPNCWEQVTPFEYNSLEGALKDFTALVDKEKTKTHIIKKVLYKS